MFEAGEGNEKEHLSDLTHQGIFDLEMKEAISDYWANLPPQDRLNHELEEAIENADTVKISSLLSLGLTPSMSDDSVVIAIDNVANRFVRKMGGIDQRAVDAHLEALVAFLVEAGIVSWERTAFCHLHPWFKITHSCGYDALLDAIKEAIFPLPAPSDLSRWIEGFTEGEHLGIARALVTHYRIDLANQDYIWLNPIIRSCNETALVNFKHFWEGGDFPHPSREQLAQKLRWAHPWSVQGALEFLDYLESNSILDLGDIAEQILEWGESKSSLPLIQRALLFPVDMEAAMDRAIKSKLEIAVKPIAEAAVRSGVRLDLDKYMYLAEQLQRVRISGILFDCGAKRSFTNVKFSGSSRDGSQYADHDADRARGINRDAGYTNFGDGFGDSGEGGLNPSES